MRQRDARRSAVGATVALALHALGGSALLALDPSGILARAPSIVEMDIKETPPPPRPPPSPPASAPEPKQPAPRPRVVPRRVALAASRLPPRPPSEAPPPPNREPPPAAKAAPPVFGVTMSSVVSGESAMAVPVGNTLMTSDRSRARPAPAAYSAEGTRPVVPVPEVFIKQWPRVIHEENSDAFYPDDARKMGIEGAVTLRVLLDEQGAVRDVKVVKKAGYGFDEAAVKLMWRYRFAPARTSDGQPAVCHISYVIRFEKK